MRHNWDISCDQCRACGMTGTEYETTPDMQCPGPRKGLAAWQPNSGDTAEFWGISFMELLSPTTPFSAPCICFGPPARNCPKHGDD